MTYSEFGRRVTENGSRGTDHGSGSCMFVAGNKVAGGLVGKHPSLTDLTDGDLKYHTDFRRVYASLLDDWLAVPSKGVLHDTYRDAAPDRHEEEVGRVNANSGYSDQKVRRGDSAAHRGDAGQGLRVAAMVKG